MRYGVREAVDRGAAVARLQPVERWATDGSIAEDMAEGSLLLDVVEGEQVVGAVALVVDGDAATIRAAASRGAATYGELRLIGDELARRGVRTLTLYTRRPGLIRALRREGWRIAECELTREL